MPSIQLPSLNGRTIYHAQRLYAVAARVVLSYWLFRYVLLHGLRSLRARGVFGSLQSIYKDLHSVSVLSTPIPQR